MNAAERNPNAPDEKPPESRLEETPSSSKRRGDFGVDATTQLASLENKVERLRLEVQTNPEAQRELRLAEKRVELFVNEHDNAGAFKFKRFGREVVSMFEERDGAEKRITTDAETGKLQLAESEKNRRVMFVNMGELDRINKEGGGHAAGDVALKETVRAIEKAVRKRLAGKQGKQANYQMLRYRGNEFMVNFDDVSQEDFNDILQEISEAKPRVNEEVEAVPLVAHGFDFQEALDIVNQVQAELPPEDRIDPSRPGAAASEIIDVMQSRADYRLDADKFVSRVKRVQEKLDKGGPEEAQAFFENYMKKMFAGTELATLDAIRTASDEEVQRIAFEYAGKSLDGAASEEKATRAIVDRKVKEIRSKRDYATAFPASLAPIDGKLATVPSLTRGGEALAEKEADLRVAEASGDALAVEEAALDYQIEKARRDGGTGLLERGVHYEDLEKAIKDGTPMKMAFVDMGFLRYFDNRGGADVGNNALKVAAGLMEQAIEKAGIDAKAYRYGGDEFTVQIKGGDADLEKFKQALEQLRDEAGSIPSGRLGDAKGYVPTELVFNAGFSDTKLADDVFTSLKEAGVYSEQQLSDPDEVANVKAELLTVIADKSIETDKAVNRFMMLAEARKDPRYESDPVRQKQVVALIEFSKKALFAEAGGNEFLESLVASEKNPQEMRKDVEAWVAKRVEAAHEQQNKKESLLGDLIKLHGKISFFEGELAKARKEQKETTAENAKLKADLEKLHAERQALIEVRKTLGP